MVWSVKAYDGTVWRGGSGALFREDITVVGGALSFVG